MLVINGPRSWVEVWSPVFDRFRLPDPEYWIGKIRIARPVVSMQSAGSLKYQIDWSAVGDHQIKIEIKTLLNYLSCDQNLAKWPFDSSLTIFRVDYGSHFAKVDSGAGFSLLSRPEQKTGMEKIKLFRGEEWFKCGVGLLCTVDSIADNSSASTVYESGGKSLAERRILTDPLDLQSSSYQI
jgi:hypothetical protein